MYLKALLFYPKWPTSGRALALLAKAGLITLKMVSASATVTGSITSNPKNMFKD